MIEMKKQKVIARMIVEVIGSPKEHVEKTLIDVVMKFKGEKNVKLIKELSYEAEEVENKMWSTFSELEFEAEDLKRLMELCFDFTPSSIEILEPAGMTLDSNDIMDFMNDVIARIHRYAMVIKNLQANSIVLQRELDELKNKK